MNFKLTLLLSAIATGTTFGHSGIAAAQSRDSVVAQNTAPTPDEVKRRREDPQPNQPRPVQPNPNAQPPNRAIRGVEGQPAGGNRNNRPAVQSQPLEKPATPTAPVVQDRNNAPPRNNQPVTQQTNPPRQTNQPATSQTNQPSTPQVNQPRQATQPPAPQTNQRRQADQPVTPQDRQRANQPGQPNQPANQQSNQPRQNNPASQQSNQPATNAPANAAAARDRHIDAVRAERKETHEGNRTVIREGDRTIVREGNRTVIRHDEVARFRFGGANVQIVQRGDTREAVVTRPGGVRIVTVLDANGRLLRRSRFVNGREFVLIQNRPAAGFVVLNLPPPVIRIPRERYIVDYRTAPRAWVYETLVAPPVMPIERAYSLDEIRESASLRERMPRIDIDTITFDTGSWEIRPDQAQLLEPIAEAMRRAVEANPNEVYMIEGFTDAVGSDEDNLSLSDRRAEAVAEVLSQQFQIPPENMTTQGFGETSLKVPTDGPEERNRRVTVQRITPLLMGQQNTDASGGPQDSAQPQNRAPVAPRQ
jgi:outer membrane protein OmpA-like peptidoglycan-associated protein